MCANTVIAPRTWRRLDLEASRVVGFLLQEVHRAGEDKMAAASSSSEDSDDAFADHDREALEADKQEALETQAEANNALRSLFDSLQTLQRVALEAERERALSTRTSSSEHQPLFAQIKAFTASVEETYLRSRLIHATIQSGVVRRDDGTGTTTAPATVAQLDPLNAAQRWRELLKALETSRAEHEEWAKEHADSSEDFFVSGVLDGSNEEESALPVNKSLQHLLTKLRQNDALANVKLLKANLAQLFSGEGVGMMPELPAGATWSVQRLFVILETLLTAGADEDSEAESVRRKQAQILISLKTFFAAVDVNQQAAADEYATTEPSEYFTTSSTGAARQQVHLVRILDQPVELFSRDLFLNPLNNQEVLPIAVETDLLLRLVKDLTKFATQFHELCSLGPVFLELDDYALLVNSGGDHEFLTSFQARLPPAEFAIFPSEEKKRDVGEEFWQNRAWMRAKTGLFPLSDEEMLFLESNSVFLVADVGAVASPESRTLNTSNERMLRRDRIPSLTAACGSLEKVFMVLHSWSTREEVDQNVDKYLTLVEYQGTGTAIQPEDIEVVATNKSPLGANGFVLKALQRASLVAPGEARLRAQLYHQVVKVVLEYAISPVQTSQLELLQPAATSDADQEHFQPLKTFLLNRLTETHTHLEDAQTKLENEKLKRERNRASAKQFADISLGSKNQDVFKPQDHVASFLEKTLLKKVFLLKQDKVFFEQLHSIVESFVAVARNVQSLIGLSVVREQPVGSVDPLDLSRKPFGYDADLALKQTNTDLAKALRAVVQRWNTLAEVASGVREFDIHVRRTVETMLRRPREGGAAGPGDGRGSAAEKAVSMASIAAAGRYVTYLLEQATAKMIEERRARVVQAAVGMQPTSEASGSPPPALFAPAALQTMLRISRSTETLPGSVAAALTFEAKRPSGKAPGGAEVDRSISFDSAFSPPFYPQPEDTTSFGARFLGPSPLLLSVEAKSGSLGQAVSAALTADRLPKMPGVADWPHVVSTAVDHPYPSELLTGTNVFSRLASLSRLVSSHSPQLKDVNLGYVREMCEKLVLEFWENLERSLPEFLRLGILRQQEVKVIQTSFAAQGKDLVCPLVAASFRSHFEHMGAETEDESLVPNGGAQSKDAEIVVVPKYIIPSLGRSQVLELLQSLPEIPSSLHQRALDDRGDKEMQHHAGNEGIPSDIRTDFLTGFLQELLKKARPKLSERPALVLAATQAALRALSQADCDRIASSANTQSLVEDVFPIYQKHLLQADHRLLRSLVVENIGDDSSRAAASFRRMLEVAFFGPNVIALRRFLPGKRGRETALESFLLGVFTQVVDPFTKKFLELPDIAHLQHVLVEERANEGLAIAERIGGARLSHSLRPFPTLLEQRLYGWQKIPEAELETALRAVVLSNPIGQRRSLLCLAAFSRWWHKFSSTLEQANIPVPAFVYDKLHSHKTDLVEAVSLLVTLLEQQVATPSAFDTHFVNAQERDGSDLSSEESDSDVSEHSRGRTRWMREREPASKSVCESFFTDRGAVKAPKILHSAQAVWLDCVRLMVIGSPTFVSLVAAQVR